MERAERINEEARAGIARARARAREAERLDAHAAELTRRLRDEIEENGWTRKLEEAWGGRHDG
ncbi:hypothetical protein DW322_11350 [Rhodococcus rhodnii]|uniref:Uncharacterized protein n=1 Tax=Rhodococcus rhodnii TaxID=38312 RepID=A0A6P2CD70_9NOCA|nr:hypothetical protein DW322_11350 [Rhodococcus rhodnii]